MTLSDTPWFVSKWPKGRMKQHAEGQQPEELSDISIEWKAGACVCLFLFDSVPPRSEDITEEMHLIEEVTELLAAIDPSVDTHNSEVLDRIRAGVHEELERERQQTGTSGN